MSTYDPVIDKIIQARVSLLLNSPFFGNLATRMKIIEVKDEWCKTAATDFRNFYFNRTFLEDLSSSEISFVFGHEVLHCVFNHLLRKDHRDHKLWNIAADYCVNGVLVNESIGEMPKKVKCFYDKKYDGYTSEQVYDELLENCETIDLSKLGELLDQHLEGADGEPQLSENELAEIQNEMRDAILQAAQAAGAGRVPAAIARMIKDWTEPKMDWRQLLRQQIQSVIKNDYSWTRPSRKGFQTGAILPGTKYDETIDICIAIDLSGSIGSEQAKDFLGEIKGIMEEYKDFNIKLWTFDTQVYNEQDYNAYNVDDFLDYELQGGGGTDFMANWHYMKENDIQPKKFIMFTDMYPCGEWGDPLYCDTIFIAHGTDIVAPFGVTAKYDPIP